MLQVTLALQESAAFWRHRPSNPGSCSQIAFENHWFGQRSENMVRLLCRSLSARFDQYPAALTVLAQWAEMDLATRRLICHWHTQLSDPIYRDFTGKYIPARKNYGRGLHRHLIVRWLGDQQPNRWKISTRTQLASKLLTTAREAGLVEGVKQPRPVLPQIKPKALVYLLYLLRGIDFGGSMTENPYLTSVGIVGRSLDHYLGKSGDVVVKRQGHLVDIYWRYDTLAEWARYCSWYRFGGLKSG